MLALIILLVLVQPSIQNDFNKACFNYDLILIESYPIDVDLSNECQANDCIILTGYVLVNDQSANYWCYKNKSSYVVSTTCSSFKNWSDYNMKQVKFKCGASKSGGCGDIGPNCILEWLSYCNDVNYPGCQISSEDNKTTTSSTTAVTVPTTELTSSSVTTKTEIPPKKSCVQGSCPTGECFFEDHCYFITPIFSPAGRKPFLVTDVCGLNQSLARGLAVETSAENAFIQEFVRDSGYEGGFLTAGGNEFWSGWSSIINRDLLCPLGMFYSPYLAISYTISSGFSWVGMIAFPSKLYAICERELVWAMAFPWLRKSCYEEYKSQMCNSSFCCAADDDKQIWFQCQGPEEKVATKTCKGDPSHFAQWTCFNGSFTSEAPDTSQCQCETPCNAEYQGTNFSACPLKYAYASCPDDGKGYMRWRCLDNGTFDGAAPYEDLCCGDDEIYNRQDPFLNVWVACPNTTVTRYVECWNDEASWSEKPTRYQQTSVNWTCGPSGFVGPTPDYSDCNICDETCKVVDDRGQLWLACKGTDAVNPCPDGMEGDATWSCGNSSKFLNDSPDYSECYSSWINDVEDMIKNNVEAIIIMGKIHEALNNDLSSTGLKKILNVTSSCVSLFVNQNRGNGSFEIFDNFTGTYFNVLDDVTNNSTIWSQLSDARKDCYMEETINMTNRVALALKDISTDDVAGYTNTFQSEFTSLSLWMAYSRNLTKVTFPYEASKNMCSVNLLGVESAGEKALFNAVGIVFPYIVSVAAFPVDSSSSMNTTVMNSAVLSMSVADVSSNHPIQQSNISMSVSFKHVIKARFPDRKLISRRLYDGEEPSPIFGASQCFFYDTRKNPSTWSSSGCTVRLSLAEETICDCHHLTSFSVLVDVHEYVRDPALEAFSLACSALSIIGLIFTLIIFKAVKMRKLKLDSDRTLIDVNCCVCLLLSHAMIVSVLDKRFFYISDKMCSVVAGILHYLLTAAFFWMSVEAYHLYYLIVLVFTREGSCTSHYFIIGYILPLIPIMLTELASQVLQKTAYGRDEICWLNTDFIWSFNGPVFLLTGINLVVIIIAMRAAITKRENSSFKRWWVWCKGLAFLCTLLGVTWLTGIVFMETDLPSVVQYIFVLLNGLQGVYIFIFQCVLNNQIRPVLVQFFMRRNRKTHHSSFSRISQKATAISSEVDYSAKTGISTLESSSEVKIIQCPPIQPGQWMFRANLPRRQWINSDAVPCDDMVRQLQRRIKNDVGSEILKH